MLMDRLRLSCVSLSFIDALVGGFIPGITIGIPEVRAAAAASRMCGPWAWEWWVCTSSNAISKPSNAASTPSAARSIIRLSTAVRHGARLAGWRARCCTGARTAEWRCYRDAPHCGDTPSARRRTSHDWLRWFTFG